MAAAAVSVPEPPCSAALPRCRSAEGSICAQDTTKVFDPAPAAASGLGTAAASPVAGFKGVSDALYSMESFSALLLMLALRSVQLAWVVAMTHFFCVPKTAAEKLLLTCRNTLSMGNRVVDSRQGLVKLSGLLATYRSHEMHPAVC